MARRSLLDTTIDGISAALGTAGAGEKLPSERVLSQTLGVSRAIVREAARSLEQRGLIEIRPGLGMFAVTVSDAAATSVAAVEQALSAHGLSFAALLEGRLLLEPQFAAFAAARRSPVALERLQQSFGAMQDNVDHADAFNAADQAFHLAIAEAAGSRLYPVWLEPILNLLTETHRGVVALGEVRRAILDHHNEILRAVEAGDRTAAREAMTRHLRTFAEQTARAIALGLLPPESPETLVDIVDEVDPPTI